MPTSPRLITTIVHRTQMLNPRFSARIDRVRLRRAIRLRSPPRRPGSRAPNVRSSGPGGRGEQLLAGGWRPARGAWTSVVVVVMAKDRTHARRAPCPRVESSGRGPPQPSKVVDAVQKRRASVQANALHPLADRPLAGRLQDRGRAPHRASSRHARTAAIRAARVPAPRGPAAPARPGPRTPASCRAAGSWRAAREARQRRVHLAATPEAVWRAVRCSSRAAAGWTRPWSMIASASAAIRARAGNARVWRSASEIWLSMRSTSASTHARNTASLEPPWAYTVGLATPAHRAISRSWRRAAHPARTPRSSRQDRVGHVGGASGTHSIRTVRFRFVGWDKTDGNLSPSGRWGFATRTTPLSGIPIPCFESAPLLRVLVVGGGIAGQAVCEQLAGRDCAITLVCGEPHLPMTASTSASCSAAPSERRQAAAAPRDVVRRPRDRRPPCDLDHRPRSRARRRHHRHGEDRASTGPCCAPERRARAAAGRHRRRRACTSSATPTTATAIRARRRRRPRARP